jgi:hypothetical protein
MARYLLLLRDEEANLQRLTERDFESLFDKFVQWTEALHRDGRLHGVERLLPDRGRTVRKHAGTLIVDGPYAEGKEAVVGLYVIEAADDDDAARIAAQVPVVEVGGSVEVRRIGDFPRPA